ncbi:MAG TPA: outer membrane beta-barrel protein [Burkholderiales bacterium]|nr:outer membrane beta-barrel protein [Burkholderiales bacterium]
MKDPLRNILVAGVVLAATSGVARAAPTFFFGTDIVRLTTRIDDQTGVPANFSGSADAVTIRLRGGAHFLPGLDAEVHAVLPQSQTYSDTGGPNSVKTSVLGIFAKPNFDAGPLNIYALLGYSFAAVDLNGTVKAQPGASGVAYGAGVRYAITPNVSGSIDFTQYAREKNVSISGMAGGIDVNTRAIGVGVSYWFK